MAEWLRRTIVLFFSKKWLPAWHTNPYSIRMSRRILLTASIVTAVSSLSPAAFSAAMVKTGDSFITKQERSNKLARWLDVERMAGKPSHVITAPLTLESHRAGSQITLAGINAIADEAAPALAMDSADRARLEETAFAVATDFDAPQNVALNPAPVAGENVGSASSFAAVPEPSSVGLLAVGAFAFLRRRRG